MLGRGRISYSPLTLRDGPSDLAEPRPRIDHHYRLQGEFLGRRGGACTEVLAYRGDGIGRGIDFECAAEQVYPSSFEPVIVGMLAEL